VAEVVLEHLQEVLQDRVEEVLEKQTVVVVPLTQTLILEAVVALVGMERL